MTDGSTVFTHILFPKVELRGKVGHFDIALIVESDSLDTSEDNVLGNLQTESSQSRDEDGRLGHLLHGFVAQNIQLTAVQALVNLAYKYVLKR